MNLTRNLFFFFWLQCNCSILYVMCTQAQAYEFLSPTLGRLSDVENLHDQTKQVEEGRWPIDLVEWSILIMASQEVNTKR